MTRHKEEARLSEEIKQLVGERLLAALKDPDRATRASMMNSAISFVKLIGGDVPSSPTEARERLEEALTTAKQNYGELPFLTDGSPNPNFKSRYERRSDEEEFVTEVEGDDEF